MGRHEVAPRRAVFLDRDGVINRPVIRDGNPYPPRSVEEFEILDGVAEACTLLKQSGGFLLVVATNQPDVGRGTLALEEVERIHEAMCRALPIDRVEVCYDGVDGNSQNRKPAPGMLRRAASELGIDLKTSFMVGDRWRDIDCGYAAGCRTVFIDWGYDEKLRQAPNWRARDLLEAANLILRNP
jgi:D-glycero-D-manno-heptose 1,7-bisphosphate phosphatase